jgi:tetratricopeptide (TPR) repeat protein
MGVFKMRKVRRTSIFTFFAAGLSVLLVSVSCSTAPNNPGDVYNLRSQTEDVLEAANKDAGRGNFENALLLLDECKRKAILADAPSLIIRSCLSRGNALLALGRTDEAFAEWEYAVGEAQRFGNAELLSVSKIYRARGNLVSGRAGARAVLDEVNRESVNIKTDRLYLAFSWEVKGLALRSLASYREAEDAVKRSLEIHERDRYLENASYDWYIIASIRSLAGDTTGALAALDASIALDRRIENSWGLAASWRARGDVYRKAGRHNEADEAYRRALAIYLAMPNEHEAAETQRRMNQR